MLYGNILGLRGTWGVTHHITFLSKALRPQNQGLSVYEKEYLAILVAVDHWHHYLLQAEFIIHTDHHHSSVHLNEQRASGCT